MPDEVLKYRMAFAAIRGMGIDLAQKLLDVLPDEAAFFAASGDELQRLLQSRSKISDSGYRRKLLDMAEEEIRFIRDNGINVTYFTDPDFPARLLNAPDAPILLYSKGRCDLNRSKVVSIVGTRNATPYGTRLCETIVADLAAAFKDDLIVVSGLAYGIDIAAHRAALHEGVATVGVLAHGLNTLYPAMHRSTANEMVKSGGALLTDYTSHDRICRANFLARNRIVAALADCTIVVESAEKGGAMVTAGIASSYNRDVFALPGRTTDQYSAGCNRLINRNVASLVTSGDDIIKAMQWEPAPDAGRTARQRELFPELTDEEEPVYQFLKKHNGDPVHINTIYTTLQIPMSQLLGLLIDLEFKGLVTALPGNRYSTIST